MKKDAEFRATADDPLEEKDFDALLGIASHILTLEQKLKLAQDRSEGLGGRLYAFLLRLFVDE